MADVLFDSKSELDKLPFGAVPAGTSVRFGLRTAEGLDVLSVSLVVLRDEDKLVMEQALSPVWTTRGYTRWEGTFAFRETGLYWYHFKALTTAGEHMIEKTSAGAEFAAGAPRAWQLTVYDPDYTTPDWIKRGAFYHIFVDRFKRGGNRPVRAGAFAQTDWGSVPVYLPDIRGEITNSDFFGGDLEGIIEKLPYLQELGICCIYLSPVFEASSNHKYDTADYLKLDPAFGDEALFAKLCAEAGSRGIRVICDGVFNHTGSDSVYFNREGNYGAGGAYRDQTSPYYEWYSFTEWPEKYDAWWGITTLPQIKKDSAPFREFICGVNGVLEKWLALGASGWRLDVADELSESFLRALRLTVKVSDPDTLIIGEVWEDASNKVAYGHRRHYLQGAELDGVMNYPLKDAIIAFVRSGGAEPLAETVETLCENYPKQSLDCLMNGLGTHDTVRILTALGGEHFETREERACATLSPEKLEQAKELLRLASLLQFTLPGVPCIYYGDEAGLEGYEDPFNRRCYPWGQEDAALIDWYRALLAVRKNCSAFGGGVYRTQTARNGVLIFTRTLEDCCVTVCVNLGEEDFVLGLSPADAVLLHHNCRQTDVGLRVLHEGCAIIEAETFRNQDSKL